MVLRLDPRLPLVWRSPSSLQVGVDSAVIRLDDVSVAAERLISALVAGVTPAGLRMIGSSVGGGVDEFLAAVGPAMAREPRADPVTSVTIVGTGVVAGAVADALAMSGVEVVRFATVEVLRAADDDAAGRSCDLGIVVASFVVEPTLLGYWLRRDVPHLAIVIGDERVRIGPLVDPGHGPCLWCVERARADADPAWPAMASQLWGRRSLLDHGVIAVETAATAARVVVERFAERRESAAARTASGGSASSVSIDARTGARSIEEWTRHPECGCAALPGTATADVDRSAAATTPTR